MEICQQIFCETKYPEIIFPSYSPSFLLLLLLLNIIQHEWKSSVSPSCFCEFLLHRDDVTQESLWLLYYCNQGTAPGFYQPWLGLYVFGDKYQFFHPVISELLAFNYNNDRLQHGVLINTSLKISRLALFRHQSPDYPNLSRTTTIMLLCMFSAGVHYTAYIPLINFITWKAPIFSLPQIFLIIHGPVSPCTTEICYKIR